MKDTRNSIFIALFTLAILLPFVGKPFNVDDPFYIKMAEQILIDPLRPYSFEINWSGELRNVWTHVEATFPPVIPCYTALIIKLFGLNEFILHLFFLIFPVGAAFGMYFVSRKFVSKPLISVLLAVSTPAFLVSSTSIMLDIPLISFSLLALAFFIYGVDREKKWFVLAGAVLAGMAILIKYTGFLLVPLFAAYIFFSGRNNYYYYISVPCIFFAAWCAHNLMVYGSMHFFLSVGHVGKGLSLHKLISFLTFFSGTLIFPLFAVLLAKKKESLVLGSVFILIFTASYAAFFSNTGFAVQFSVLALSTVFFIYKVAQMRCVIGKFLMFWFFLALAIVFFIEPWMSGRYLLIVLPPAAIIFSRILEYHMPKLVKTTAVLCVLGTFMFGMALTISDYLWAESYRSIAGFVKDKGYNDGVFAGHFGFQYYLEQVGMQALQVNEPVLGRGYLVAAKIPDPQKPGDDILSRLRRVGYKAENSVFPVRVMDPHRMAGFYSSFWGIFPFSFSNSSLDEFVIYEIESN